MKFSGGYRIDNLVVGTILNTKMRRFIRGQIQYHISSSDHKEHE